MAGKKHHFPPLHTEVEIGERIEASAIPLAHPLEKDHDEAVSPSSSRSNSASTKSLASKGRRSSIPSPTPMKRMGVFNCLASAKITPPLAVPSSLVRIMPVTGTASLKVLAWAKAF